MNHHVTLTFVIQADDWVKSVTDTLKAQHPTKFLLRLIIDTDMVVLSLDHAPWLQLARTISQESCVCMFLTVHNTVCKTHNKGSGRASCTEKAHSDFGKNLSKRFSPLIYNLDAYYHCGFPLEYEEDERKLVGRQNDCRSGKHPPEYRDKLISLWHRKATHRPALEQGQW